MAVHADHILAEWHDDCAPALARFNERTGEIVTDVLGSMTFFWFCACLDLLALPGLFVVIAQTLGAKLPPWTVAVSVLVVVVSFVSQTVIQLLALPALQHAGNVSQKRADARAEATYRNSLAIESMLASLGATIPEEDA